MAADGVQHVGWSTWRPAALMNEPVVDFDLLEDALPYGLPPDLIAMLQSTQLTYNQLYELNEIVFQALRPGRRIDRSPGDVGRHVK